MDLVKKFSTLIFGVKSIVVNVLNNWKKARDTGNQTMDNGPIQKYQWSKPPEDWIKVNIYRCFM